MLGNSSNCLYNIFVRYLETFSRPDEIKNEFCSGCNLVSQTRKNSSKTTPRRCSSRKKRKADPHDIHIKKRQNTKVFPLYVEQRNNAQKEKRNRVPKSQWADRIKRSEYTSPTTPLQHSVYE